MSDRPSVRLVVPCYNEADRLAVDAYRDFAAEHPQCGFVFVNDGSDDATLQVLRALEAENPRCVAVVDQQPNQGKAAAVRAGMQHAFELGCEYAGYWDADLATPLQEVPRFLEVLRSRPGVVVVFGARVQLLGRHIERRPLRHYLGRVFATAASNTLRLPVYDTQCGAKLFRVGPTTRSLFEAPFLVNWTFDVELVARLLAAARADPSHVAARDAIYELPLDSWRDVAGSKVGPLDFLRALFEMWRIRRHYFRGRGRPAYTAPPLKHHEGAATASLSTHGDDRA